MTIERRLFPQEGFGLLQKMGMVWEIRRAFVDKNGNPTLQVMKVAKMTDEELFTYYVASQISPAIDDNDAYKDADNIHLELTQNLVESIYKPGNPDLGPEKTAGIVKDALFIARGNWKELERDRNQPWIKRTYAAVMIRDIDERLGLEVPQDPLKPFNFPPVE